MAQKPLDPLTNASTPTPEVSIRGANHGFTLPDGTFGPVLEDIDLEITKGEFVAIVGPSGCGKTTLLNLISGMQTTQKGEVLIQGTPPRPGNPSVGYLFARDALLPWRTVMGNAELALQVAGVPRFERRSQAENLLKAVGLSEHKDAYPAQLSQGMRQRVAIARTLAPKPDILLLDEPFSALDAQTKVLLQDTFSRLWQELQATVVLITHDLSEAIALADRIVMITARPGRIKTIYNVGLSRPRSIMSLHGDANYHHIYEQLWTHLRDEVKPE